MQEELQRQALRDDVQHHGGGGDVPERHADGSGAGLAVRGRSGVTRDGLQRLC